MASEENAGRDGAGAVGDAIQVMPQGLVQLQEALRLQEQRAATAMQEMERKLQEKDDAILALQQRLEETQARVTAVEERTAASEDSGGGVLESRVKKVEASLQSALQSFFPRVDAVLRQLEKPQSTRASSSPASARPTPVTGGAAAGGGGEPRPPEAFPAPSSSNARLAKLNWRLEELDWLEVEVRALEVEFRMEETQNRPSPEGTQLCKAARDGRLSDVQLFIDSGANVNYTDEDGLSPLLHAVRNSWADVVSLLLQRGADVNAISPIGNSALHFAAWKDSTVQCVNILVDAEANVNARNVKGETPLHVAAYGNGRAVHALLAAGARRDLKPWDGRWRNKTPYDLAESRAVKDLLRVQGPE